MLITRWYFRKETTTPETGGFVFRPKAMKQKNHKSGVVSFFDLSKAEVF
jgi:hypothetical protein